MDRVWETKNSKIVYSNPWIKIREDTIKRPDGKETVYGYMEDRPGIFIVAQDRDDSVYLIKEFRYPVRKAILQLPAGSMESDNLFEQAKKELFEETGITAKKWEKLGGVYPAAGHETTYVNFVLARDLDISKLSLDNQESDESILEIIKVKIPELKQMILDGKIECGLTIAALHLFFLRYDR